MARVPTIAIVGRANVGKSTLFNRLTGTREALVSDMPGLTRDRREGEADIAGCAVCLVDTAGLEEGAAGSLSARMRKQTDLAIANADLVLFVVDARAGVMPADKAFAVAVRASGRPAILVANKNEGRRGQDGFYEGFELGLGDPVAISAEHGEGIGALLGDVAAALGLEADPEAAPVESKANERPVRIAIVGRPNVGKSTLVNALIGEERMITGPEPGLTRDAVAVGLTWQGRALRLFDTAGLRRKARVSELPEKLAASDAIRAIRFAEVVVLTIDSGPGFEHQDLTIGDLVIKEGRALVVAINKWDLIRDKQRRLAALREDASKRLSQVAGLALVPISAKEGKGLDALMKAVLGVYEGWNKRVPTPELNRWLAEALERHAPPAVRGKGIRIRYMTQPSTRPPTFIAFCQRAEGVPGAYVRYLANSLREAFGLKGVPIRLHLRKGGNPFARRR